MINYDGEWTLDTLVNTLGMPGACDFLEKSLPQVIQIKETLQQSLQVKDYKKAAECAQHTLGSIRFFGSGKLERLMLQIADNQMDPNNVPDLQRKLSREFESVIRTIKWWLAEDKPKRDANDTFSAYLH